MPRLRYIILLLTITSVITAGAQSRTLSGNDSTASKFSTNFKTYVYDSNKAFKHLDLGVTVGTPGVGIELSAPLSDYVNLRMGGVFMPHLNIKMRYGISVENLPPPTEYKSLEEFNAACEKYRNVVQTLAGFTGYEPSDKMTINAQPKMNHFKLLVDVFPFKNKKWHVTGGFYWGNTNFSDAENDAEAMNMLISASVYNTVYNSVEAWQPVFEYNGIGINFDDEANGQLWELLHKYGRMNVRLAKLSRPIYAEEDIYYDHDVMATAQSDYTNENWGTVLHAKGDIMYHKGDMIKDEGDYFRISPDGNNMITAHAKVNAFKPYLGFGYSGSISNDGRTKLSVDAGLLFWGGVPELTTRVPVGMTAEGVQYMKENPDVQVCPARYIAYSTVNMCNSFSEVYGSGTKFYINLVKALWAYPVISIKLSQRLF